MNDHYGEEPGPEMTLRKSQSVLLYKTFMRLEPKTQTAIAAFSVFWRALNGLIHYPPAFAQYCNATRQHQFVGYLFYTCPLLYCLVLLLYMISFLHLSSILVSRVGSPIFGSLSGSSPTHETLCTRKRTGL
jgi:hypothetical protein